MRSLRSRVLEVVISGLVIGHGATAFAGKWAEHAANLNTLSAKLAHGEEEIKKLIEHKQHTDNPEELREIVNQIASKHKELEEVSRDYEKERLHVRFQHPDRAETGERKYERFTLKSVKEIENEMGMDGRLDRIKSRVLSTFPVPEVPKKQAAEAPKIQPFRKPASHASDEEAPERIRLVK